MEKTKLNRAFFRLMKSKKWGAGAEPWTGRKPPHPPTPDQREKSDNCCIKMTEKFESIA
jgi:hypothetical protein